jgi:hypothetical protein
MGLAYVGPAYEFLAYALSGRAAMVANGLICFGDRVLI